MLRCPVCKAENTEGPACRRCKADLSALFALDVEREECLVVARHHLRHGETVRAMDRLVVAERYRGGPDVQREMAAAALLHGDFATAWRMWRDLHVAPS